MAKKDTVSVAYANKMANIFLAIRLGFGVIWAVDAAFKFEPAFYHNVLASVKAHAAGEPAWLNPWFHMWYAILGASSGFWAVFLIVVETGIALSLLLGFARKANYLLGAVFSFLIWSVAESFGGPYVAGSTDGIIYVIVFLALYGFDGLVRPKLCVDTLIARRVAWWPRLAEVNPSELPR
jgi:thiosulfate dehydrogenase [quinone] large subunit